MILHIDNLHVRYGGVHALKGISLEVHEGEIVTLIGPNGAGKTTLLRTISGLIRPLKGEIRYFRSDGSSLNLTHLSPHEVVREGIAQVPEGRLIFQNLTVKENLDLGAYSRKKKTGQKEDLDRIFLLFPRLKERLSQNAGTLSGGEQQMLSIGRALMAHPRLLLLDEPSLGIAPALVQQIFKILVEINQQGTTILLVEQDAFLALKTSRIAYVLESGEVKLFGDSQELMNKPEVKAAYLGG